MSKKNEESENIPIESTSNNSNFLGLEVKDMRRTKSHQYGKVIAFFFKDGDPVFVIGPDCKIE